MAWENATPRGAALYAALDRDMASVASDPTTAFAAGQSSTFGRVSAIPRARGAVVFTWDDGYPNWLAIAQAASARGQKHTFGVTTSRIGITGGITSADVAAIHALGHEIASHSVDHDVIPNDTAAQRVANYDNSKTTQATSVPVGLRTPRILPPRRTT